MPRLLIALAFVALIGYLGFSDGGDNPLPCRSVIECIQA